MTCTVVLTGLQSLHLEVIGPMLVCFVVLLQHVQYKSPPKITSKSEGNAIL